MNGRLHGLGEVTYLNGDKYKGEFIHAKRNGFGLFRFKNGNWYQGDHIDNSFNGYGKLIKNGKVQIGEFRDN